MRTITLANYIIQTQADKNIQKGEVLTLLKMIDTSYQNKFNRELLTDKVKANMRPEGFVQAQYIFGIINENDKTVITNTSYFKDPSDPWNREIVDNVKVDITKELDLQTSKWLQQKIALGLEFLRF